MIPLRLDEVAAACAGRLAPGTDPAATVSGPVVADSRQVVPGALFVALPGERADGHDFAAGAVQAGAVAVLAGRDVGVPAVLVADPQIALARLARAVVDRLADLVVVGVTGSSGKTSTKDLLAHLLSDLGPTVAPPNSFNNEIGLPLTALRCETSTRFLVSEMGARMPGHISYLCEATPPRIAVVLNVGHAHLGVFGDRETIARTKGELPAALPADGVAVLNADDPLVREMAERTQARVVWTGRSVRAEVRADDVRLDDLARASFTLVTPSGTAPVALRLHGEHHVGNALAAAAVALEAGMPLLRVAELLATATPASRWRMEVQRRGDGVVVVNDAYNANPDSVRAALAAVGEMAAGGRRAWAVLGEMLELGPESVEEHLRAGLAAAQQGVARLVAVGGGARPVREGYDQAVAAGEAGAQAVDDGWSAWVDGPEAALALLRDQVRPGDVVLVKASRAIGLDRVGAALLADVTADSTTEGSDGVRIETGSGSEVRA